MKLIGTFFLSIVFLGCSNYENPDKFTPTVGEKFSVYSEINSCCNSCPIEMHLKHTKLVSRSIVDPIPDHLAGASGVEEFVFQAISTGTDTIKIKTVTGMKNCQLEPGSVKNFLVEVK